MARYKAGLQTRSRILDATRSLLGEQGLEGTTLKAICERAGVMAGSFYNLFGSKDEAVIEVVKQAIAAVDPHPEGSGDTLEELVEAYIRFVTESGDLARIYVQMMSNRSLTDDDMAARMLRHHRRRVERFAAAVGRGGGDELTAAARAEVILATLNGLAFMSLIDPTLDFAALARSTLTAVPTPG